MPNGNCMKCGKPIAQGILPHYYEKCMKELGLEYNKESKKYLEEEKRKLCR